MFGGAQLSKVTAVGKTNDESVTSSTTLQDDDHLFFTGAPNTLYVVDFYIRAEFNTLGQIKIAINAPSANFVSLNAAMIADGVVTAQGTANALATAVPLVITGATSGMVHAHVGILIGSTGGQVVLQWAQNTSNGTATTVKAGSYLIANQI